MNKRTLSFPKTAIWGIILFITIACSLLTIANPASAPAPPATEASADEEIEPTSETDIIPTEQPQDEPYNTPTPAPPSDTPLEDANASVITIDNIDRLTALKDFDTPDLFRRIWDPYGNFVYLSTDEDVRVYSANTLALVRDFSAEITTIAFAPNQTQFAVAVQAGIVTIHTQNSETILALLGHEGRVTALTFSPDNTLLATTAEDNRLMLWNVADGSLLANIDISPYLEFALWISSLEFSPDGSQLAAYVGEDATLLTFSTDQMLAENPNPQRLPWREFAGPVADVFIAPDWRSLAWVSRGTLRIMSPNGDLIGETASHEGWVIDNTFLTSQNAFIVQTSITVDEVSTGVLIFYDLNTATPTDTLVAGGFINDWVVSPAQDKIALLADNNSLQIWDTTARTLINSVPLDIISEDFLPTTIVYSPDGSLLVLATGNMIRFINVETLDTVLRIDIETEYGILLAFQADGRILTTLTDEGKLTYWGVP